MAADGFPCSPTKECKEARRHGVIEFVVLVMIFLLAILTYSALQKNSPFHYQELEKLL